MPALPIISTPFCQAGLAGYSDRAMRLVARHRGCPYAVTEAILDTILLAGGRGLTNSVDINDEDHPIAGQIIGSDPETMSAAAKLLQSFAYDVIDLNYACPVKKIKNKARGGHMLRDLPRAVAILRSVRDTLSAHVPTTVSLRRGFDDSAESEDNFYQIADTAWSLGYSAIRVHARTVEQKYQGTSDWSFLKRIKNQYPNKTIFGSGDLFTAEAAVRMLRETGVDYAWIARGAIGNPWIFDDANRLMKQGTLAALRPGSAEPEAASPQGALVPPSILAQREALAEHFGIAMEIHGEQLAGRRMRKMGIKYARFHPMGAEVKRAFIEVHSLRQWNDVLHRWYSEDAPGIWPAENAADEVNSCEPVA
jgi:tRNA-dihydrouridine synthase B